MKKLAIALLIGTLVFATGCGKKKPETIHLSAAASLRDAMEEIIAEYEKEHPDVEIILNTDSSGTLQKQIQEGAPADIFFSAGQNQMNALIEEGLMDKEGKLDYLENRIVLIKPKGMETKVTSFDTMDQAKTIAIANADTPVGEYARELLKNIGKYDAVFRKEINEGANVTAVLMAVKEGASEVGIVYETDARSVVGVEVIDRADSDMVENPSYPIAYATSAMDKKVVLDFFDFLTASDSAKEVLKSKGFDVLL